jgi:hypothetical protein
MQASGRKRPAYKVAALQAPPPIGVSATAANIMPLPVDARTEPATRSRQCGVPTSEASQQAPMTQIVVVSAPDSDVAAMPVAQANHTAGKPKPVTKKAAVIAFLKNILSRRGWVAAKEVQERAVEAGLIGEGA